MNTKSHNSIAILAIALGVAGGLQALVYILNKNLPLAFLKNAALIYIYFVVLTALFYDLHFKNRGVLSRARLRHADVSSKIKRAVKIILSAFKERLEHVWQWDAAKLWLNYLLLPGFLYWATIIVLYLNFGRIKIQETIAVLSSLALILAYWHLKEIFSKRQDKVRQGIFISLSIIKIYASFLLFAGGIGLAQRFCFGGEILALGVFGVSFLLAYQALFQKSLIDLKSIFLSLILAALVSVASYVSYANWSFNYFTAGVFLTAVYNFLWTLLHEYLESKLNWKTFGETFAVFLLVGLMIIGSTNFKERILDSCRF